MPRAVLPPQGAGVVSGTIARVERIERVTNPGAQTAPAVMTFTYPGGLSNSVTSPPWFAPRPGVLEIVRVSLGAVATSDHTIEISVNDAPIEQFTLTAGNQTAMFGAAISIAYDAFIKVKTISVTDSDLVIEVRVT